MKISHFSYLYLKSLPNIRVYYGAGKSQVRSKMGESENDGCRIRAVDKFRSPGIANYLILHAVYQQSYDHFAWKLLPGKKVFSLVPFPIPIVRTVATVDPPGK